jgi:muconate cycloisomerase
MRIDEINLRGIRLPFVNEFSHSLKKGAFADNIVVETVAESGDLRGYGEGAPRSYVTGESRDTVQQSIGLFLEKGIFPWELNDVSQIWDFVDSLPDDKRHNAALCGLEMSLLDLLGKKEKRSVSEYLPQGFSCNEVTYGAVLPLGESAVIIEIARFIKKIGIDRLKLKMNHDYDQNKMVVDAVSSVFKEGCDLKIDVNGAWDHERAIKHLTLIRDSGIKAVEQPMRPGDPDIGDFSETIRSWGVMVMADESACSFSEVQQLVREGHYNMINVRLSKCGGFRKSLQIINYLREQRIGFQIACQLGESGLLSAAGRILSLLCKDALYHDGSYDALLLKENVTENHVSFGLNGKAGPLGGTGLSVGVSRRNLERLSDTPVITFRRP